MKTEPKTKATEPRLGGKALGRPQNQHTTPTSHDQKPFATNKLQNLLKNRRQELRVNIWERGLTQTKHLLLRTGLATDNAEKPTPQLRSGNWPSCTSIGFPSPWLSMRRGVAKMPDQIPSQRSERLPPGASLDMKYPLPSTIMTPQNSLMGRRIIRNMRATIPPTFEWTKQ